MTAETTTHCILAGFDAFEGAPANVSQQAVELAPDDPPLRNGKVEVRKVILPTCCDLAWDALHKCAAQLPQKATFALVISGMAQTRTKISIERFALNVRDYRIADNRGHQWGEESITKDGPLALRTNVDITKLRTAMKSLDLHTETSYHAGTFVCNETYFRALEKWSGDPRCKGILFIHLPAPADYAATCLQAGTQLAESDAIKQYALGLAETMKFICA